METPENNYKFTHVIGGESQPWDQVVRGSLGEHHEYK